MQQNGQINKTRQLISNDNRHIKTMMSHDMTSNLDQPGILPSLIILPCALSG